MNRAEEFANALNSYKNLDVPINKTLRLIGISAIKKQIPLKPRLKYLGQDLEVWCPCCDNVHIFMDSRRGNDYCQNCGQKLDWSDDNE